MLRSGARSLLIWTNVYNYYRSTEREPALGNVFKSAVRDVVPTVVCLPATVP